MIYDEILGDYPEWKGADTKRGYELPKVIDWALDNNRKYVVVDGELLPVAAKPTMSARRPGISRRVPRKESVVEVEERKILATPESVPDEAETAVFVQKMKAAAQQRPTVVAPLPPEYQTEVFRRPGWDSDTKARGALSSTQKIKLVTETRIDPRPGGKTNGAADEPGKPA